MSVKNGTANFSFFIAGLGIGATLALLFAPKSGEELRRLMAGKAEEGKDLLAAGRQRFRKQTEGAVALGRELVGKGRERFAGAVEAGRQTYNAALGR